MSKPVSFSSHRVILKVGEQPNPNNHTTRDPKGKSVIVESSRNAKVSQCFKCQGYGHVVAQYPSSNLLVREAYKEIGTVAYEPTSSATDSGGDVSISSIELGVVRYLHTAVRDEDRLGLICSTPISHMKGRTIN